MNKEKVMQLVTNLYIASDLKKWGYIQKGLQGIEDELNSKPVMPKVFDDFAKHFDLKEQYGLDEALDCLFDMYMYGGSKYEDLEDYMRSARIFDDAFYADCVNACVYRYEVEK